MDPPELIVNGAIERHVKMVKECRGLPGLKMERFILYKYIFIYIYNKD